MRRTAKRVPMCCITIGYQNFLLPFQNGMKVVEMMHSALEVNEHYDSRRRQYVVKENQSPVEFVSVNPADVVMPSSVPRIGET
jgi:hypothetical protein